MDSQQKHTGKNLSLGRFFLILLALMVFISQFQMVIQEIAKVIHIQLVLNISFSLSLNS